MKTIKVELVTDSKDEVADMTIVTETNRLGAWSRDDARDITSGTPEAKTEFRLRNDQRIVIEGRSREADLRYDPIQAAAINTKAQEGDRADAPSEEIPHPDNNPAVKQEMQRLNAAAKVNKTPEVKYGDVPEATRQITQTVPDPRPTPTRTETKDVRTPDSGARPQNMPVQNTTKDLTQTDKKLDQIDPGPNARPNRDPAKK